MGKDAATFECTACGQQSSKWLGRCPGCGGWNTLDQVPDRPRTRRAESNRASAEPISLSDAELADAPRVSTGLLGLDRVLGGGLVPGSVVLLAGEPGIGKSTLLLQAAANLAADGPVLYLTAEESARQVAMRAHRLGCVGERVLLLAEPIVDGRRVLAMVRRGTQIVASATVPLPTGPHPAGQTIRIPRIMLRVPAYTAGGAASVEVGIEHSRYEDAGIQGYRVASVEIAPRVHPSTITEARIVRRNGSPTLLVN
ncbi:MAG TPA: ATPase domain-containing protein, partial [Thermoanaerobaculaceae bacterium]|nr:ATPase domain-containing protein [Thermoanaerobaculaceae bacterium]